MINTAIAKLAAGQNLAGTETREAFNQIMSGGATNAQIAAFITAMRMKGETIDEITACAQVLREKCSRIHTQGDVLDIVGTGGDCANTFNISTTSAFVISAAGQPVAKHGNRSVSSNCRQRKMKNCCKKLTFAFCSRSPATLQCVMQARCARKSASEPFLISLGLWQTRPLQVCSFWAFTRRNWCCHWRACFQTSALNAA